MTAFERETERRRNEQPAFELRIMLEPRLLPNGPGYRLALWQRDNRPNGGAKNGARHLVTVGGAALQVVLDQVLDTLRREGYRPTVLRIGCDEPIELSEEAGVRLGLLFLAVKPLARVARMEAIASGIRAMPGEEAYYWFSKVSHQQGRGNALRALRVLLAAE